MSVTTQNRASLRFNKRSVHCNIQSLPPELQKELTAVMSRPDFDPDKLAEALEKAQNEQTLFYVPDEQIPERCPWYETVQRIFLLLGGALFLMTFFLLMLYFTILIFDSIAGTNMEEYVLLAMQNHPVMTLILLGVIFLVYLVYLIVFIGRRLQKEFDKS